MRSMIIPLASLLLCSAGFFYFNYAQLDSINSNSYPSRSQFLNHRSTEQPECNNSTVSERIVQFYSSALKGNFISGKEGEYELKASIFGIGKIIYGSKWSLDTEYLKRKHLRNIEASINLKLKEGQEVNGVNPSLKYALVNNRDRTEENFSIDIASDLKDALKIFRKAVDQFYKVNARDTLLIKKVEKSFEQYNKTQKFEDLDEAFSKYLVKTAIEPHYDSIAEKVDKKLLWTWSVGANFTKEKRDSLFIKTEVYHGIGTGKDIVFKGLLGINDTSSLLTHLDFDKIACFISAGLDAVLLRAENVSLIDGNVSIEYGHIFKKLTPGEEKNQINFAISISPLIALDLSLPITLKYNPKNGKVFGFFEVQWNLKPIKKGE
jgi:hypothetical protein